VDGHPSFAEIVKIRNLKKTKKLFAKTNADPKQAGSGPVGSKNPRTGTTFVIHKKKLTRKTRQKDMQSFIQALCD